MNDIQLLMIGAVAFKKASREFLFSDRSDVGGILLWNAYYYNVALSFELSLKCFLAHSNYPPKELKNIGHDLIKCFDAATNNGFRPHDDKVFHILRILSPVYKSHELRYLKNKALNLPASDEETIEMLDAHIRNIAEQVGFDFKYANSP